MNQDLEHLRLLALFHYVFAAVIATFSLLPLLHLAIGIAMTQGLLGGGEEILLLGGCFVGLLVVILATTFVVVGLALAACLALAGKRLARQESYTFCIVVAGISCAFFPFGTVLGVFTLIVLMRDSVRELFGEEVTPAAIPPALEEPPL